MLDVVAIVSHVVAGGSGITLSTGANSVDVVPYFVKATNSIQIGAVQKAFS